MLRHLLIGVLVGLVATSGCAGPHLVVRTDRGQAVQVDLEKVQPVEYGKAEFQEAMGLFADHVAAVIQSREGRLRLRLASSDPMAEAYLAWCDRRNAPGDCLELLDAKSPGLSNDGKRSIAVRMALGTALEEVASVVRHVDPMKVEALLLIWFTIYFASLVFPDVTITKAVAFVMSAKLVAFLGWDGFRSFVLGYRDMCKAADAAQTFAELYDAGRAYGNRMGPSMVRIVTVLVTLGLSSATGMSVPVTRLPGGGQAVGNAQAMGFRLGAVSSGSVAVSTTGTVTLVLAAQAAEGSGGGDGEGAASRPSKLAPLKQFEIDKYSRFSAGCRVGDELCGHEVLQNSWLREHGFASRRGADASRDNPAIAVDRPLHDRIAVEQRNLGLFDKENVANMSAERNIELNAQAMRAAGVPEPAIQAAVKEALRYAASLAR